MSSYITDGNLEVQFKHGLKRYIFSQDHSLHLPKPLLTLIDDDPIFCAIMKRQAEIEWITLDCLSQFNEQSDASLLERSDALILDYDLGSRNALQVLEVIRNIKIKVPTLIISASDRSRESLLFPPSVKTFMNKAFGYSTILQTAVRISQERVVEYLG